MAAPATLVADIDLSGEPTIEPCILGVCPPLASYYGSLPSQLVALGDRVVFVANDHLHGDEPWVSDGSAEGTHLVADLTSGADGSAPTILGAVDGRAVFFAHAASSGHLWSTDGTTAGTQLLDLPCEPTCSSFALYEPFAIAHRGELFFQLYSPTASAQHIVLYRTDGTSAGTHEVTDLCAPGPNGTPSFCLDAIHAAAVAHGSLYLGVGFAGVSRWLAIDEAGSAPREPVPGCVISRAAAVADRLLFVGTCAGDAAQTTNLYALDGPGETPRKLAGPYDPTTSPGRLGGSSGTLAWFLQDGALWRTDGSVAGTFAVPELTDVTGGVGLGNRQLLVGRRVADGVAGLFALDAGGGVTLLLASEDVAQLGALGEVAFIAADVPGSGSEPWSTDGTPAGTRPLGDIALGPASSHPGRTLYWFETTQPAYAATGDRIFFAADDGTHGIELWAAPLAADPPPPEPTCTPAVDALCLLNDRFRVQVTWTDFADRSGVGTAVPLTGDTGAFWFFAEPNLELMVKLHDGRAVNGHYWVFYGGLTNVAFTLRVTDTVTGATWEHANPAHQFASGADTLAFADPPSLCPVCATTSGGVPSATTTPVVVSRR